MVQSVVCNLLVALAQPYNTKHMRKETSLRAASCTFWTFEPLTMDMRAAETVRREYLTDACGESPCVDSGLSTEQAG